MDEKSTRGKLARTTRIHVLPKRGNGTRWGIPYRKYQEADKVVERYCRRDKRNYANSLTKEAARERCNIKGGLGTLYNITRKPSGRSQKMNKPIRNIQWKIRSDEALERSLILNKFRGTSIKTPRPIQTLETLQKAKNYWYARRETLQRSKFVMRWKVWRTAKLLDLITCQQRPSRRKEIYIQRQPDFLNEIWNEEGLLEDWATGLLIRLSMKGNLSYSDNWRGIMLH